MSIKQRRQQTTPATKKAMRKKPTMSPLARKATRLYQTKLKALLEPADIGKFAAIEPDSGDYFVASRMTEAMHEARLKHPDKRFFLIRIGFEAAVTFRHPGPVPV